MIPAFFVSGWAHPARVLCPLAEAMRPDYDPICLSTRDLGDDPSIWACSLAERIAASARPPLVVGWSLGGILALDALTAAVPPAVSGLVMISSTPRFCAAPHWPWGQTTSALRTLRAGLRRDPRAALLGFLSACAAPGPVDGEAQQSLIDEALAQGLQQLAAGLDYLGTADLTSRRGSMQSRLVCIHGGADRVIPCEASRALAESRAGVLEVLQESGHSVPMTSPLLVAETMRRGLRTS